MNEITLAIQKIIDSNNIKNDKEFYDIQDVCFILGLSKSTVYKKNANRFIPSFKPNGSKKVYFLKKDVSDYLHENRFMSQQEILQQSNNYFQNQKGGNHDR